MISKIIGEKQGRPTDFIVVCNEIRERINRDIDDVIIFELRRSYRVETKRL